MSKTIQELEKEVIDEFAIFDDWMDKYNYLIEIGKELPLIDPKHKTESNLIHGCQSRVWLHARLHDDKVLFSADSDAVITRGIISLLIRVLSNQTPEAILSAPLTFIDVIGLRDHLSVTRSNGLMNMIKQMKIYALAFISK